MKPSQLICQIVLVNSLFYQTCHGKLSFEGLKSYLFGKAHEKIVHKEIPFKKNDSITIHNICGDIVIKEWKHNSVQLRAKKSASKKEMLDDIKIVTKRLGKTVTIQTEQKNEVNRGAVDYELIVPRTATLSVQTNKGSISISRIQAPIQATTQNGNISINNTSGPIIASTQQGSITIENHSGTIRATSDNGNITINQADRTVFAQTNNGTICTSCKKVPALDTISLSTNSGNIELALPRRVNADLQAHTEKGKLISDHYITVKPQTVKLNKHTWARLKKEVNGTLGTGEAIIKLSAGKGNIRITKTT